MEDKNYRCNLCRAIIGVDGNLDLLGKSYHLSFAGDVLYTTLGSGEVLTPEQAEIHFCNNCDDVLRKFYARKD